MEMLTGVQKLEHMRACSPQCISQTGITGAIVLKCYAFASLAVRERSLPAIMAFTIACRCRLPPKNPKFMFLPTRLPASSNALLLD